MAKCNQLTYLSFKWLNKQTEVLSGSIGMYCDWGYNGRAPLEQLCIADEQLWNRCT